MTRIRWSALVILLAVGWSCDYAPGPVALEPGRALLGHEGHDSDDDDHEAPRWSAWSDPVLLGPPVNSPARELGPHLAPDGLSLYFGSDRDGGIGAFDIWVSRRACQDCPWGEPVNLGPGINSPTGDGEPELSPDGLLLFFSGGHRAGGHGGEDIWMSRRTDPNDDLGWQAPVNLGPAVNTTADETSPAYAPALLAGGVNLYFARTGDAEIYQTRVTREGQVVASVTPVAELNDPTAFDSGASVRADGREVFFWSSGRAGATGRSDIWVATRRSPRDPWSVPRDVGPPVNTTVGELVPGLSRDGRTLFFSAAQARGGLGLQDIWMTTRTESRH